MLGELLSHAFVFRLRSLKRLRHVIDGRIVEDAIEDPQSDRIRKTDVGFVREDGNADPSLRNETRHCAK